LDDLAHCHGPDQEEAAGAIGVESPGELGHREGR
jgi:hypothetical protein